jgi:hypothetical protein
VPVDLPLHIIHAHLGHQRRKDENETEKEGLETEGRMRVIVIDHDIDP